MNELKILQINVWSGRIRDGLTRYISEGDYDVVCMQEAVWDEKQTGFLDLFIDTVDKIKTSANFEFDFRSKNYGIGLLGGGVQCERGNVILSKIPFKTTEEKVIFGDYDIATDIFNFRDAIDKHRYTAQKVVGLVILNHHGYWLKDPLGDEVSVRCMRLVADMVRNESMPVVMCGDLNVIPESRAMRELDFLTDLTSVNDVKTTLMNVRFVKDVACDHILVSEGISYKNFRVMDTYASDHKALAVDVVL